MEAVPEEPPDIPLLDFGTPPEPPTVGAIYRGRVGSVSESGHIAIVNRGIDRKEVKRALAYARDQRNRVRGLVFGFNRGGFDVLVGGIRVFCPASGMSLGLVENPEELVGQAFEFTLSAKKSGGQGFVVSRRSILERELRKARKQRIKSLEAGQELSGKVTSVRDFGAFVDLGDGVEGLVHMSELSWNRGDRPADAVTVGQDVNVKVLKVGGEEDRKTDNKDKRRRDRQTRVSLSIKALLPDPWEGAKEVLEEGKYRKGKVVRTTDFGAFVELSPGIEGLLHISELGKDLKHASQALDDGAEVDVVVERVDFGQRRISLSRLTPSEVKAIEAGTLDPKNRPKSLKPGSHIMVVVDRTDHHGVHVQVKGVLGRKGRGYISNRELGGAGKGERRKGLTPGTELEVKITGTDRDGSLRCSVKGREVDEERRAVREYRKEASKQGFGTFGDLLRQKLSDGSSSD
ncbi:MAG: S1 RNA-binding domain-containing protein [Myxococcota bacterium]